MVEIIKRIITNVLAALYQPFVFSVIVAILFMFLYISVQEQGWKKLVRRWVNELKTSKRFRCMFLLVFYTTMILFRTLLNRNMWANPLADVIGVWGIYNAKGELTTEVIENLVLFIPFTVLLLCSFRELIIGQEVKLFSVLWQSVKVVFLFSLTIELLQLFLRLGTFQLPDLFYNTMGGIVGGLLYWSGCKISSRIKKSKEA